MDVLDLLIQDHRDVAELFKEVEALGPRADASRAKLFAQIDDALTLHTKVEERLFYPELKARAQARSEELDLVLEAYEEHAVAKTLLKELEKLDPSDETYRAKLSVLVESVKHHVKEEEGELFPTARKFLSRDEREEIGEHVVAMKERAPA